MNRVHPKKLLNSKWTAVAPVRREKHFLVTAVEFDEAQNVVRCTVEALMSKRESDIDWRELTDPSRWRQGWV
jgi:tryptophan-rich hypothetical protein